MNQPLISVIVPVYNVEKYLDNCVMSILDQDYQNIEIILINDGSTDNSLAICHSYVGKDKRVKLFSQKNQGLSAARNLGIQKANGEFVMFVDSDDYVEPSYCSAALSCQQKYDADIVFFDYKRITNENEIIHSFEHTSGVVTKEEAI